MRGALGPFSLGGNALVWPAWTVLLVVRALTAVVVGVELRLVGERRRRRCCQSEHRYQECRYKSPLHAADLLSPKRSLKLRVCDASAGRLELHLLRLDAERRRSPRPGARRGPYTPSAALQGVEFKAGTEVPAARVCGSRTRTRMPILLLGAVSPICRTLPRRTALSK
jgi:hypothetical protein